ncbi:hypothetical protein AeNC1_015061 [Aphanomyces euteiches]|nr:hypothetical protein AeNC1_015061 [Aphanomyces euteiches]
MSDLYYVPPSLRLEFSEIEMVELMEQFKEFDTSGDGAVDANELKTMMESMNVSINMEELEELIAIVDTNGSGQIEFHEFVRMMSNLRRGKSNKLGKFMQLSKQAFQIRREFQALVATPIPGCRIEPVKRASMYFSFIYAESTLEDMRRWNVYMEGPTETPYAGGSFHFHIQFGHEYPYEPPDVCLRTQIYHINFILLLDGTAAIPWLAEIWTPGTTTPPSLTLVR